MQALVQLNSPAAASSESFTAFVTQLRTALHGNDALDLERRVAFAQNMTIAFDCGAQHILSESPLFDKAIELLLLIINANGRARIFSKNNDWLGTPKQSGSGSAKKVDMAAGKPATGSIDWQNLSSARGGRPSHLLLFTLGFIIDSQLFTKLVEFISSTEHTWHRISACSVVVHTLQYLHPYVAHPQALTMIDQLSIDLLESADVKLRSMTRAHFDSLVVVLDKCDALARSAPAQTSHDVVSTEVLSELRQSLIRQLLEFDALEKRVWCLQLLNSMIESQSISVESVRNLLLSAQVVERLLSPQIAHPELLKSIGPSLNLLAQSSALQSAHLSPLIALCLCDDAVRNHLALIRLLETIDCMSAADVPALWSLVQSAAEACDDFALALPLSSQVIGKCLGVLDLAATSSSDKKSRQQPQQQQPKSQRPNIGLNWIISRLRYQPNYTEAIVVEASELLQRSVDSLHNRIFH